MMRALALVLAAAGCASGSDGFRAELDRGCSGVAQCDALETAARDRLKRCRGNCDEETRDVLAAASMAQRERDRSHSERLEADRARFREADQKALAERREEQQARAERQEAERANLAARYQREDADRKRQAEEKRAERLRLYRVAGREERARHLIACYQEYAPAGCAEMALEMYEAVTESDRAQFLADNERILQAVLDHRPEPELAALQCCDGSRSGNCACGGKLSGCCDGHGGVCGCVK